MRILLDEQLPRQLAPYFVGHDVRTTQEQRWAGLKNGALLKEARDTVQAADVCVVVPDVNPENVTPHTEAFQAVVWHLLVSHPALKAAQTKWESTEKAAAPSSSTGTA